MSKRNHITRRKVLKGGAAAAAAAVTGASAPAVLAAKSKYEGTTINGAAFSHVFNDHVKDLIPEFEEATGIKVNFQDQAFPIYNQRADLELSTQGSGFDFLNVTFIFSGRWIGAGWMFPLDEFINDPNMTPPDWGADDFAAGAQAALQDADGKTYGFAWEAGAMIMSAARGDLLDAAGVKMPESFEELTTVCDAIHDQEGVAAFVADKLHHWNWIPYLMGHGGSVFVDPPGNLTPTLATPEAAEAAEYYANILTKYTPDGVLSFTDEQAMNAQLTGRANIRTQAIAWHTPLATSENSKVKETVKFSLMPGQYPGSNSHGWGIPVGAKNKEAAWEFIKWIMSPEVQRRIAIERGYSAVTRRSIIESDEYRQQMTFSGQDVASMYLKVLELGGKSGYMKYRTVPVFPQIGDKINKAIERVATGQQNGKDAMAQAQRETINDFRKAGIKIDA